MAYLRLWVLVNSKKVFAFSQFCRMSVFHIVEWETYLLKSTHKGYVFKHKNLKKICQNSEGSSKKDTVTHYGHK